jgi:hypothetical protein
MQIRKINKTNIKNATEIKIIKGHEYYSGFVKFNNGNIVYFNTGDLRITNGSSYVRFAKDFKDFTGGKNFNCVKDINSIINTLNAFGNEQMPSWYNL